MLRLTKQQMKALEIRPPDPANPYDVVVRQLADRIADGFKSRRDIDSTGFCAIGPLNDPTVNARCFRSAEGFYAIVMHHGLMNLLHKHSKLLTAAVSPRSVVYCNRASPADLTSEVLASWAEELGPIYRATGETKGALVKLDQPATAVAAMMLTQAEAFVLGHEIGHVLAGHLEQKSRLVSDEDFPWLEFYAENSRHSDEFEADRYGFEAMRDYFEPAVPKSVQLGAVVSTLDALNLIGAGATSPTHPSARDRIQRVVDDHFSADTATLVHRWLDDGDRQASIEALKTAH
jgi:hypothetical protein